MNERFIKILNHPLTIPVVTGVVSFGCGVGAGFLLGKTRRKKGELYELPRPLGLELDEDDLARIREADRQNSPTVEDEEVEEVLEASDFIASRLDEPAIREEILEQLPPADNEEEPPVPQSIFAESDGDWDYEEEEAKRKGQQIYIIHEDEFHAQEMDFHQTSATFYEGDEILADENNVPIYQHPQIVGEFVFGHGSSDPNICFVRNEKRQCEYEILRHTGMYSQVALGLDIEDNQRAVERRDLRHSSAPGKFRKD